MLTTAVTTEQIKRIVPRATLEELQLATMVHQVCFQSLDEVQQESCVFRGECTLCL